MSTSTVFSDETTMIIEGEHLLQYGDVLSIERLGQTFHVVSGCAWITFDGQDLFVLAGEDLILEPGIDPAVISALEGEVLVYYMYGVPELIGMEEIENQVYS